MLIAATAVLGSCPIYDVAVIGAGPAGISLVTRLLGSGLRILLIEAGGRTETRRGRDDKVGFVVPGTGHPALDLYRVRALGGASRIWGGRAIPLDPIDFRQRDWIEASGWPIPYSAVAAYYPDAFAFAEAGDGESDPACALPGRPAELVEALDDASFQTTLERFSRPTDFWKRYGGRLTEDRDVHVLGDATVVGLTSSKTRREVTSVEVDLHGARVVIPARAVVLATGGLEVARLLLASGSDRGQALGDDSGLVGRYYMGHYCATFGSVTLASHVATRCGYERDAADTYVRRRLWLSEAAQKAHRLLNVTFRTHIPEPANPEHGDAVLSAMFLAKSLVQREYAARFASGRVPFAAYPRHLANIAKGGIPLTRFAHMWARDRIFADRKLPSVVCGPIKGQIAIEFHCEQSPCYESRVTLSDVRDRHGVPRLMLDWRCNGGDIDALARAYVALGHRLSSSGLGRLDIDLSHLTQRMIGHGLSTGHHIGTTRMSGSPKLGVVDGDCRVHGLGNLFVASSSVFPTSGQANPTLTIIALAMRLADRLKKALTVDRIEVRRLVPSRQLTSEEVR